MKIAKQYIKRSVELIDEYDKLMNIINHSQNTVNDCVVKLQEISDMLNKTNLNNVKSDLKKKEIVIEAVDKYQKEIEVLNKIVQPHLNKVELIKKESLNLYTIIKEKYPQYDDKQLKEIIILQMDEYKKENLN